MKAIRILSPCLLTVALLGACLWDDGDPAQTLRTDGAGGAPGDELVVEGARTPEPGDQERATTSPGEAAGGDAPGADPTTSSTSAPATTAAPVPTTTTLPPIARPTGDRDANGQPVWTPAVDATGATDVSGPMAAFLAAVPDGSTIELAAGGRYRMEQTLLISRRRNLTIRGAGATFLATTPGDQMRANVRIADSAGISIHGLKVVGANPLAGAKDRVYRPERGGQHGFDVNSSTNVSLIGVTVTDTYGDFVYLGRRDGGPFTDGVLVQGGTFARSGRQGITLTAARNVVIESSSITEAKRSTFDFEPGRNAGASVDHVTIRNNRVSRGALLFVAAEGHGPVDNITIEGNRLTGMTLSIAMEDLDGGVRRSWRVLNNTGDLLSGHPDGATMRFRRIIGLVVQGNHQAMKPDRDMYGVGVIDSCNVSVTANSFPNSAGQVTATGAC